jgi:Flp pilus assembly protein TadG
MRATRQIEKAKSVERANLFVALTPAKRRRESGERGSTLFEFAMVAVITLVLMFGMIDLARALYSYHFVTTAAREGARFASVRGALCSSSVAPPPCPAQQIDVQNFVTAITPQGIDAGNVTATLLPGTNTMPVCGSGPPFYPGCMFTVTVTYQFKWIFPAAFYSLAPVNFQSGTIVMSSTSEMVQSR